MAALTHSMRRGVCVTCGPSGLRHADGRCAVGAREKTRRRWREMTSEARILERRINALKHKFGMTVEDYDWLLASQGGVCAVCGQEPGLLGRRRRELDVDHDHSCCPGARSCGRCVRGLLCSPCNRAIGYFRDDPDLMRAAVRYLEAPR